MRVGKKEKCCEKDCKTPQEYMNNHFVLHIVQNKEDKEELENDKKKEEN